jgi:hypothetical protein
VNKLVNTWSLGPAPVADEEAEDDVELPPLLEFVADSVARKLPPTPVELTHLSVPNVIALPEKVISAH